MGKFILRASFSDLDAPEIEVVTAISKWAAFSTRPQRLTVDADTDVRFDSWIDFVQRTKIQMFADWCGVESARGEDIHFFSYSPKPSPLIMLQAPDFFDTPDEILGLLEDLSFGIAAFGPVRHQQPDFEKDLYGMTDGHVDFGWGCAFKGQGHDRLVSRRWLERGPWVVHRGKNDTTMLQFHPLDLDLDEAERIALPAWKAINSDGSSGLLPRALKTRHNISGLYDAASQTLRVVVPAGRKISTAEMRDACTVRRFRRDDPKEPIRQVSYRFIEPADAHAHLHDLWLRELECWTFTARGEEVRLDADYQPPPPQPPEWAR